MEDLVLKVEHLSHRYSVQWAVRDISFEIPRCGIYGLLGSNGAGKSTTMNIISGVIKPTEGYVWINGVDTREDPIEAKRMIGFLPQKPPLYGDFTVEEYIDHCARLRWMRLKDIPKAVDEVLEKCGLSHFRKRLIKNLSGGYQQRVGIAQAIVHHPHLVIFDEPTNGLDPNQIQDVRGLIRGIAEESTVILSTHILTEVQAVCDHILMIEQGKLVFTGTVDEFDNYIAPSSLFVSFGENLPIEYLERISGVTGVEELGGNKYRLRFSDATQVMDGVVKASGNGDWHLTELRLEKNSMDKVFAELSKKIH